VDDTPQSTSYNDDTTCQYGDQLVDEFGRTLEQQLQDNVAWQYTIAEDQYRTQSPYDRLYVTDEDGGPQYKIFDCFPRWHYQHTIEVLEDGYETILPDNWP